MSETTPRVADEAGRTVRRPRVAISLGDPRGIGPEVTRKAVSALLPEGIADFLLVGPAGMVAEGAKQVAIGQWSGGSDETEAGRLAGLAIERSVRFAMEGEADALVTAPIDKRALLRGGWNHPGHTELLHSLTDARAVGMLMVGDITASGHALRVLLATTHMALRDVPDALSVDLLVTQTRLAERALRDWWGLEEPCIALCAVNPHASDGGRFGSEEKTIMEPAVRRCRDAGMRVVGPVPADTVFVRALRGEFDAVVAPYHDVGMAAFKTATFGAGVNVTLGLPFPRTSPDHGTALDIAGRGVADPGSMIRAIRLAARLATGFDSTRVAG